MPESVFLRMLNTPIDAKGDALAAQIVALNSEGDAPETFIVSQANLRLIPGSPFAYWVSPNIRDLFQELNSLEPKYGEVRTGLQSLGADEVFIRTWWEVKEDNSGISKRWVDFAKGGESTAWFGDVHLVTDWEDDGIRQKEFAIAKYNSITRKITGIASYFHAGLTYTAYTNKGFHVRALPANCIFSLAGPGILLPNTDDALWLQSILNSKLIDFCLRLITDRRKWEPGYIKLLPIKQPTKPVEQRLAVLTRQANDLQRQRDLTNETAHAFCLPGLASGWAGSLRASDAALYAAEQARQARLGGIQAEIDEIVFDLYGLGEDDRVLIRTETGQPAAASDEEATNDQEDGVDEEAAVSEDMPLRVQNLLMWCVGVVFGRWDIRKAVDFSLLPELDGPFDPLPRCAPGALMGLDLPAAPEEVGDDYPLPVAWDGILVDDPANRAWDIVERVREVLTLLWGDQAVVLERDMLGVLGVESLREYFRNPHRFFDFHIKRYSKSRRKAPIYWLLQSEKRNYGIWLYMHRLRQDALYVAARNYADAKVALEETHLSDLQQGLEALSGGERKRRERDIDAQDRLVAEVMNFRRMLDQIALLNLPPDMNDGVVIGIAPLHPLVPWKEAERYWNDLIKGKYEWSTMSQQMRARGLVKG